MSEIQGTTLAETLRAWKHELSAFAAVSETLKVAASMVPDDYRYENRADDYLRGYDDRQPEVDALKRRVQELEAAVERWQAAHAHAGEGLTLANREQQRCYKRIGELEAQLTERPQPAAVGVVGNISWAVVEGTLVTYRFGSRETAKNRAMRAGGRFVAIVDPDAVVMLQSTEPVAWRDDRRGEAFFTRSVAAQGNTTTVTPLYAGSPDPGRGEA